MSDFFQNGEIATFHRLKRRDVRELEEERSARLKEEHALRESEKKYREILRNVSDLWIQHSPDGTIQEGYFPARQGWGYTDGEITGMNMRDLMPERYQTEFDKYVKEGGES